MRTARFVPRPLRFGITLLLLWLASSIGSQAQPFSTQAIERIAGHEAAAGRLLVKLRATATAADVRDIETQADADKDGAIGDGRIRVLHSRSKGVAELIAALARHAQVEYVEPDYLLHALDTPDDPAFASQWSLSNTGQTVNGIPGTPGADVHATTAWSLARGSASTVIGIVDGGFDYTHIDLADNVWAAPHAFTVVVGGQSLTCPAGTHGAFSSGAVSCDPLSNGPAPHATHVAGIAGAAGNNGFGIAGASWHASLMSLNFMPDGSTGYDSDAINVIEFAIQVKTAFAGSPAGDIRILNSSWGGSANSQALQDEIDRAAANDILFVDAAGNSSADIDTSPDYPASFNRPNQLTVASSTSNDTLSSFSNFSATSVHLAAPGSNIFSTLPGGSYGYMSGTSMASPLVAGAAALVLSRCALNTADLKTLLMNTVDRSASFAQTTVSGGRLNMAAALEACAVDAPNSAPSVSLLAPLDGTAYSQSATIDLQATAADTDGAIVRVDFYAGSRLIGTAAQAPYSFTWSGIAAGTYALTAVATDNEGAQTRSDAVTIVVSGGSESSGGGVGSLPDVVVYASDVSPADLHGGWSAVGDVTAAAGVKLATPDNGSANATAPLAAPSEYVDVSFTANAGVPYTFWLRMQALGDSKYNDSVWVQFSDAVVGSGQVYPINSTQGLLVNLATDAGGSSVNGWGWQNGAYWLSQATTLSFATSGTHTARIQIREDGVAWDQLVLSPGTYLSTAPGGTTDDRTIVSKPTGSQGGGSLPAPWASSDVGATGQTGHASVAAGVFSVAGAGADIWGASDSFQYVNQSANGDLTLVARVTSEQNTSPFAKAGIMLRDSLAADAAHVVLDIRPTGDVEFMTRASDGANEAFLATTNLPLPAWVRLVRSGTTVAASVSADGNTWTPLGTATFTPSGTLAGLIVCSHTAAEAATATFDNVSVTTGGNLPAPWVSSDVGATGQTGHASVAAGVFSVAGAGADIWGASDSFQYVNQSASGDLTLVARVTSEQNTSSFAKAGIMLRDSLAADAAHVVLDVRPTGDVEFMTRASDGASETFLATTSLTLPAWVRLARSGTTVTASVSADGNTWTPVGTASFTPSSELAGLIVCSHTAAEAATATFDNVSVTPAAP